MFSGLPPKTAVFIDYSNLFYAKYTVGRFLDIENLLKQCKKTKNISLIGFYGAYDAKNINQYNRVQNLMKTYSGPNCMMYLKPLEQHGSKNKGNVDTEMGFDLSEHKDKYDTLLLFSGDGDFAYPLKELISQGKNIIICSTKGHVSGLVNLTQEYKNGECRFLDFNNKTNPDSVALRKIIKDVNKGLAIHPHLQEFISISDKKELRYLHGFVDCMLQKKFYTNPQAKFRSITDKNGYPLYKHIKRRNQEELNLLLAYLKNLI